MLWIVGALLVGSITAVHAARERARDMVFVSPTEPISVVNLRFSNRRLRMSAALREASRMLW